MYFFLSNFFFFFYNSNWVIEHIKQANNTESISSLYFTFYKLSTHSITSNPFPIGTTFHAPKRLIGWMQLHIKSCNNKLINWILW